MELVPGCLVATGLPPAPWPTSSMVGAIQPARPCGTQMGPMWAAHVGPTWVLSRGPIWDPGGAAQVGPRWVPCGPHMGPMWGMCGLLAGRDERLCQFWKKKIEGVPIDQNFSIAYNFFPMENFEIFPGVIMFGLTSTLDGWPFFPGFDEFSMGKLRKTPF